MSAPDALPAPGLVDVVHRYRGGLGLPPGQYAAAAGWRDASHVAGGFGFARATSISSRTTVTPLVPHPAALHWSERAERASFQQTKKL